MGISDMKSYMRYGVSSNPETPDHQERVEKPTEAPGEKRDSLLSRLVEKKEEAAQKSAEQEQVRQESEHSMDSYYCDNRTI